MNNGKIAIAAMCLLISTGCKIFSKSDKPGPIPTTQLSLEAQPKVLLKLSGPADWLEGKQRVANELMRIPYVIDACVSNKYYGSVFVHLAPTATYNIKDFQRACKLAGYDIVRAAEISW
tara:strand:- start:27 stop:383 length:357 start_codon:yes stop_codon:yes gene_type:complete